MAFTAQPTFSVGQKLTASQANLHSTGITELQTALTLPFGSATTATGTAMASSTTPTEQTVGTAIRTDGGFTLTSGRLVVPTAGVYDVTVYLAWPNNGSGSRYLTLGVNGAAVGSYSAVLPGQAIGGWGQSVSFPVPLNAGDTLSLFAWQNSGSSLTPTGIRVAAAWVRP
jgi:hypothetical protein